MNENVLIHFFKDVYYYMCVINCFRMLDAPFK